MACKAVPVLGTPWLLQQCKARHVRCFHLGAEHGAARVILCSRSLLILVERSAAGWPPLAIRCLQSCVGGLVALCNA